MEKFNIRDMIDGIIQTVWIQSKPKFPPMFGLLFEEDGEKRFALSELSFSDGEVNSMSELAVDSKTDGWFMIFHSVPQTGDDMVMSSIINESMIGKNLIVSILGTPHLDGKIYVMTYENVFGTLNKVSDGEVDQEKIEFLGIKSFSGIN